MNVPAGTTVAAPATHLPAWQLEPLAHAFALAQPPQWPSSPCVFVSQPFAALPSQSANGAVHDGAPSPPASPGGGGGGAGGGGGFGGGVPGGTPPPPASFAF